MNFQVPTLRVENLGIKKNYNKKLLTGVATTNMARHNPFVGFKANHVIATVLLASCLYLKFITKFNP